MTRSARSVVRMGLVFLALFLEACTGSEFSARDSSQDASAPDVSIGETSPTDVTSDRPTDSNAEAHIPPDDASSDADDAGSLTDAKTDVVTDAFADTGPDGPIGMPDVINPDDSSADVPVPGPILHFDPQSTTLSDLSPKEPASTKFLLRNDGNEPSGTINIFLEATPEFSIASNECNGKSLMPMSSCRVIISFLSPVAGFFSGQVTASAQPGGLVRAEVTASAIDFLFFEPLKIPPAIVNTSSQLEFLLHNNGPRQTGVVSVRLDAPDQFVIVQDRCSTFPLNPGASCHVFVNFSPTSEGHHDATLVASATPGGETRSPFIADAYPAICPISSRTRACDECIQTNCLMPCGKCAANPDCKAIWDCVLSGCAGTTPGGSGPTQECVQNCFASFPGGVEDASAFYDGMQPGCIISRCVQQCPQL